MSRKDSDSLDAISSDSRSIPPELRQSLPASGTVESPASKLASSDPVASDPVASDYATSESASVASSARSIEELLSEQRYGKPVHPLPPAISDRLELLERIGEGGMSTVYKARHLILGKIFAVKILNPHLTAKPQSLMRFQREAKAASTLNHPNVITVHDCGVTKDKHAFLIMDYLDGKSLADVIEKEGKLQPERAMSIFLQTCDALAHAHLNSVIHRDLKPSNIMLLNDANHDDFVKIVDFGIAKLLDAAEMEKGQQNLTQTGDVFGSPLYMSPEQCTGQKLDKRSDIYSMGCLMYETLTGKPPLIGANALETMHKQLNDTPAAIIDERSPNVLLRRLDAISKKCLSKDRKDRYQDMNELRNDLIIARDEPESRWRAMSLAAKTKKLTPAKRASSPLLLPAIATLVISSLIVAIIATSSEAVGRFKIYDNRSLWASTPLKDVPLSKTFKEDEIALKESLRHAEQHLDATIDYLAALEDLASFYKKNGMWKDAASYYSQTINFLKMQKIVYYKELSEAHCLLGVCLENQALQNTPASQLTQPPPTNQSLLSTPSNADLLKSALVEFETSYRFCEQNRFDGKNWGVTPLHCKESLESTTGMLDAALDDITKSISIREDWRHRNRPEWGAITEKSIYLARFEQADLYRRQAEFADPDKRARKLELAQKRYSETKADLLKWIDQQNKTKETNELKKEASAEEIHSILAKVDFGIALCQLKQGNYDEAEKSLNGDPGLRVPGALAEARKAVTESTLSPAMEKDMRAVYLGLLWHTNPLRAALASISNSEIGQEVM